MAASPPWSLSSTPSSTPPSRIPARVPRGGTAAARRRWSRPSTARPSRAAKSPSTRPWSISPRRGDARWQQRLAGPGARDSSLGLTSLVGPPGSVVGWLERRLAHAEPPAARPSRLRGVGGSASRLPGRDRAAPGRAVPAGGVPLRVAPARVRRAAAHWFDAGLGTRHDEATARDDPHDLPRIDAFYLRSRSSLRCLMSGRRAGWLLVRRSMRRARRLGGALVGA
jgi:hypothetical protein